MLQFTLFVLTETHLGTQNNCCCNLKVLVYELFCFSNKESYRFVRTVRKVVENGLQLCFILSYVQIIKKFRMKRKINTNYKEHQTRSPPGCKSFHIAFVVIIRFHSLVQDSEHYDLGNTI